MRGSPPIQALFLILTLLILGFLGSRYIRMDHSVDPTALTPEPSTAPQDHTEAEIELVFSSRPVSYSLKIPGISGGENIVLFQSDPKIENPAYHDITIPSHHLTTYWLDIIWPAAPTDGARHFTQLNISPSHGAGKSISFWCGSEEMNETFDYNTEGETSP